MRCWRPRHAVADGELGRRRHRPRRRRRRTRARSARAAWGTASGGRAGRTSGRCRRSRRPGRRRAPRPVRVPAGRRPRVEGRRGRRTWPLSWSSPCVEWSVRGRCRIRVQRAQDWSQVLVQVPVGGERAGVLGAHLRPRFDGERRWWRATWRRTPRRRRRRSLVSATAAAPSALTSPVAHTSIGRSQHVGEELRPQRAAGAAAHGPDAPRRVRPAAASSPSSCSAQLEGDALEQRAVEVRPGVPAPPAQRRPRRPARPSAGSAPRSSTAGSAGARCPRARRPPRRRARGRARRQLGVAELPPEPGRQIGARGGERLAGSCHQGQPRRATGTPGRERNDGSRCRSPRPCRGRCRPDPAG